MIDAQDSDPQLYIKHCVLDHLSMKFLIQFIFLTAFSTPIAFACRGTETQVKESLEDSFKKAQIVFIGTIISMEEPKDYETRVSLKVDRKLKRLDLEKPWFRLETGRSCDLGRYAEIGSRWIIFADKVGDKIYTRSHSQRIFDQETEASILKMLK